MGPTRPWSHENVWLTSIVQHKRESFKLSSIKDKLMILHKDDVTYIEHIKGEYVTGDWIKHI